VGLFILLSAAALHFLMITLFGRLPRVMGWLLTGAYGIFLYKGLIK
jgi:cation:H+ antiporter